MALFNNSFPATYQPYYQQQYHVPVVNNQNTGQQQTNSGIIWVQGEAGAKSYLVAPNTTVQLWDSENQVIYLKSADASGMPSIKTLDYTVRSSTSSTEAKKTDTDKFISKDELNALQEQVEALKDDLEKVKRGKQKKVVERVMVEDDE